MRVAKVVILYVIFCIAGTGLEWGYGAFWNLIGDSPWLYGDSALRYTSLEGIPLWGMGGLICVAIYLAYRDGNWKKLAWAVPPVALAALWIVIFELLAG